MINLKISTRLKTIANITPTSNTIADIGTDHALLSIYLINKNKAKKIYATDINKLPLEKAKNNINKYKLDKKIFPLLGNGLRPIENKKIDTIIISGIGPDNIINILKNIIKLKYYKNINYLILSPNKGYQKIRKVITKKGFFIKNEDIILENNKIYEIILFEKGKKRYSKNDFLFGPILKRKKEDIFFEKWQQKEKQLNNISKNLSNKYLIKKLKIKMQIKQIKRTIK